jgi:DNA-directed RNA polymerase specialized sigma24 family protein
MEFQAASWDNDPWQAVASRETVVLVESALNKMTSPRRAAVLGLRGAGAGYEEIAKKLGISVETARQDWVRGIEEFKVLYKGDRPA